MPSAARQRDRDTMEAAGGYITCRRGTTFLRRTNFPDGFDDSTLTLSSTLRIFARLVQTPAQKIAASETMRTACSTGAAVRPKGPNGTHRSFHSDQ